MVKYIKYINFLVEHNHQVPRNFPNPITPGPGCFLLQLRLVPRSPPAHRSAVQRNCWRCHRSAARQRVVTSPEERWFYEGNTLIYIDYFGIYEPEKLGKHNVGTI